MLDVIEGRRGGAGEPVEVRESQVKTGAIERRVSRESVMTGLDNIRTEGHGRAWRIPREANMRVSSWRVVSTVDVESAKHGRKIYGLRRYLLE